MKKTLFAIALAGLAPGTIAKIPPPQLDEAAKAKAAEAAAKAAWQAKIDAYQLCKAQDRVAAKYGKGGAKPAPAVAKAPAAAAVPAASGTPTPTTAALPPCAEPGPFAYNPPEQKPLEAAGAHSPTGTAANPPNVKQEAAKIQPPGKSAKQ